MIKNLTIIIPFYNGQEYLSRLLDSLPDIHTIIVDDCSDGKPTIPSFGGPSSVTMIQIPEKGYFSGAVNFGINLCTTDVLVLNQDTYFDDHWFFGTIDQYRDRYAMIGEKIKGENPAWPEGYIHGTCMFLRRDAIEKIGGLDAYNYPLWGSTALWQLMACRAGFEVLPIEPIYGFRHERNPKKQFGSSIQQILDKEPEKTSKFIQIPPLVSVIIPTYNHARYLPDAIYSLIGGNTSLGPFLHQSFQSFEIIVVDDASTDDTPNVLSELCNSWTGVRSIRHSKNQGTAAALNTGIRAAFGKYITTMSADDMRESWSLEELVRTLEQNPHSLVYDSLMRFNNGKRIGAWQRKWEEYNFDTLLTRNTVPMGTMFEKSAWKEVGGYPEQLKYGREDWGYALAMGRMGYCGIVLDNHGYLYRRHNSNRTLTNTTPEWRDRFLAQMVEIFPDLYRGRFPVACCGKGGSSPTKNLVQQNLGAMNMSMARGFPGAAGMTLVEYMGKNVGTTYWGGPKLPSGKTYEFGDNPRDKIKLVDDRDVKWFLDKRGDGGITLFARVKVEPTQEPTNGKTVTPTPASNPTSTVATNESILVSLEIGGDGEESVPDPSEVKAEKEKEPIVVGMESGGINPAVVDNMTIKEALGLTLTKEQWRQVHAHEQAHRNRKTFLSLIEEKIEE